MSTIQARVPATARLRIGAWLFAGIALSTLAAAAAARLHLDLAAPLWLDESWTGAFAAEPTLASLTDQVRNESNAPAYYYFIWAWAQAFGISNVALHLPSMILSFVAPGLAWFGLRRERSVVALSWAALLAAWLPGIDQADNARCYALLSCAAVLSTVAHLRVIEAPSLRRATAWAVCAAFMTLVHYHAGLLAFAQGLSLLAAHRARALRLWPAALAFVPAFAVIAWHAPRLADFARTDVAWYDTLTFADMPLVVVVLLGGAMTLSSFVAALLVGALSGPDAGERGRDRLDVALWWAGGTAVAAAVACVAIGVMRPTFTFRYLTPFAPGTLLLAATWVSRIGRSACLPSSVLLAGPLVGAVLASSSGDALAKRLFNFETASAWLAETHPSRLVFFWDHPATRVETTSQLDAVGGFFLRRSGLSLAVTPLRATAADMNGPVLEAAGGDAAILWMDDVLVRGTTSAGHPPRLASSEPGLECRDFGGFNVGVVACRRRPAPSAPSAASRP